MNRNVKIGGGLGATVALLVACFTLYGQMQGYIEHKRQEAIQAATTANRLAALEQAVCRLQRGRWRHGECLN
jgi:hypothetical protein